MAMPATEHCIVKYFDNTTGEWVYPEHWEPRINEYLYQSTTSCDQPFDIGPFVEGGFLILLVFGIVKVIASNTHARSPAIELKTPDQFNDAAKLLRARTDYLHAQIGHELRSADLDSARRLIEGEATRVEVKK